MTIIFLYWYFSPNFKRFTEQPYFEREDNIIKSTFQNEAKCFKVIYIIYLEEIAIFRQSDPSNLRNKKSDFAKVTPRQFLFTNLEISCKSVHCHPRLLSAFMLCLLTKVTLPAIRLTLQSVPLGVITTDFILCFW